MKALIRNALLVVDWLIMHFVWLAALILKAVRRVGIRRLPASRATLMHVGIYPLRAHYYEPQFGHRRPKRSDFSGRALEVIRERVEELRVDFFSELGAWDALFIDSSYHQAGGGRALRVPEIAANPCSGSDLACPKHLSPRNYLSQLLVEEVKFWNEQYLLEAFFTQNRPWRILGAPNYMHHHHFDALKAIAPTLSPEREPGSFHLQRVS